MTDSPLDHETFCKGMAAQRGDDSYTCVHGRFWSSPLSAVVFEDCVFRSTPTSVNQSLYYYGLELKT